MYDLIIIGGGPGLTATFTPFASASTSCSSPDLGGMTNYHLSLPWAEDYQVIRGLEVVNKFKSELEYLKFARQMENVEHIEKLPEGFVVHTKDGAKYEAKALIIATGTRTKRLGVPGEKDYIMRGLCFSALSYAPLFIDKETAVVAAPRRRLTSQSPAGPARLGAGKAAKPQHRLVRVVGWRADGFEISQGKEDRSRDHPVGGRWQTPRSSSWSARGHRWTALPAPHARPPRDVTATMLTFHRRRHFLSETQLDNYLALLDGCGKEVCFCVTSDSTSPIENH
jgi:hypothetical protein